MRTLSSRENKKTDPSTKTQYFFLCDVKVVSASTDESLSAAMTHFWQLIKTCVFDIKHFWLRSLILSRFLLFCVWFVNFFVKMASITRLRIVSAIKDMNKVFTPIHKEFESKCQDYVCQELDIDPKNLKKVEISQFVKDARKLYRESGLFEWKEFRCQRNVITIFMEKSTFFSSN